MKLSMLLFAQLFIFCELSAATQSFQFQNSSAVDKTKYVTTCIARHDPEEVFIRHLLNSQDSPETAATNAANYALKILNTLTSKNSHLLGTLLLKANQRFVGVLLLERCIETYTESTDPRYILLAARFFKETNPLLAKTGYALVERARKASKEQRMEAQSFNQTFFNSP